MHSARRVLTHPPPHRQGGRRKDMLDAEREGGNVALVTDADAEPTVLARASGGLGRLTLN